MGYRKYLATGLILAAIAGLSLVPRHAPVLKAELALPDLDTDHHAETLLVTQQGGDPAHVQLYASAGQFTHDILTFQGQGPYHFIGGSDHWRVLDSANKPQVEVRIYRARPDNLQLIVYGGGTAKRYIWVDRGFLKLDAYTVIPGFSVGLLKMGDPMRVLSALSGPAAPDGSWQLPVKEVPGLRVEKDAKGMISRIEYESPLYVTQMGVHVGSPLADFQTHYPGRRYNDQWISARYGMLALLDEHDRARAIKVSYPWRDRKAE
jgi:hypothetical protein